MISKILDKIFGNKIVMVKAKKLHAFAGWEEDFVFNKSTNKDIVDSTIRSIGQSVLSIKRFRTKKIQSPNPGRFRSMNNSRVTEWYD